MTITALPTPPSRNDPSNFATRADAFLGALPDFATEANALAAAVNADEIAADASATAAASSASAAASSASSASSSASAASSSASAASASASAAAASYDSFDDRYLGAKSSDPSVDNDGNALLAGALYWNTTVGEMRVYSGTVWVSSYLTTGAQTISGVKTFSSNPVLSGGTANGVVYLDGSKVATSGSALTFDGSTLSIVPDANRSFKLQSYGTYSMSLENPSANAGAAIQFKTNGNFIWSQGASDAMTLTSTGLGIGTTTTTSGRLNVQAGTAATGNSAFFANVDGTYNPYLMVQHSSAGVKLFNSSSFGGSANNLIFGNGSTAETMRLDSSGNLGLGVTPSAWNANNASVIQLQNNANIFTRSTGAFVTSNFVYNSSDTGVFQANGYGLMYQQNQTAGTHVWLNTANNTSGAGATASLISAMTLDASGNLLVGTTSDVVTAATGFRVFSSGAIASTRSGSNSATSTMEVYSTGAAAFRFYVDMAGTVYATNTTISAISDQRFKENIQDLDVGLNAIMALKPRKFDWKAGKGKDIKGDRGFIAQEIEQVFPDLIDEWKGPAPEGEEPYKSVRADLIPVLVKAIQEQQALIESLTSRVAQLEGTQP